MNVGIPGMGQMQRALRDAHAIDSKANERIATGKSVNSASDNAATFAVSSNLDAFTRSRNMLARSLNTQLQISEIADAGLAEVNHLLKRAREIAVQARSETLNSNERQFLQAEFESSIEEINRVAQTTQYEEQYLLRFRGIDIGFVVDRSSSMNGPADEVRDSITRFQQIFADGKLDAHMGVAHYYEESRGNDNDDGTQLFQDIGAESVEPALQKIVTDRIGGRVDPYGAIVQASGEDDPNDDDGFAWRDGVLKRVLVLVTDTNNESTYTEGPPLGDYATTYGETETANLMGSSDIVVHDISNSAAPYDEIVAATGGTHGDLANLANPTGANNPLTGTGGIAEQLVAELQNQTGGGIKQVGIFNNADEQIRTPVPVDVTPVNLNIDEANLSSAADAGAAIERLDAAIDTVNSLRSEIGAYQVRMDSIMDNNMATTEIETAAMATMTDANIAEEMAKKLEASVKAQAASALLMQAKALQRGSIEKLVA